VTRARMNCKTMQITSSRALTLALVMLFLVLYREELSIGNDRASDVDEMMPQRRDRCIHSVCVLGARLVQRSVISFVQ
jgi:phosphoenolpyruvate carboxylase